MQKEPLATGGHLDLDLEHLIPDEAWEEALLQNIVEASVPSEVHSHSGRSFAVYTRYDANGWFTLELHEERGYVSNPNRTGGYMGLCCVVVPSPPGVTVYCVVEADSGWESHLSSHAHPDPEPRR